MAIKMRFLKSLLVVLVFPWAAYAEVAVVLNSKDDDMSLIDTASYKVIKRVPIGKEPHHLLPTPDNRYLVIANAAGNDLVLVDPVNGDILKRIPRIPDPYHLGFSPDQKWFVITANRLDRVDIYRYENADFKLAAKIPMARTTSHMAFSPDSQTVFVSVQESNEVAAIDLPTQKVKWKVASGKLPASVWVTPDAKYALVAMTGDDYVEVLSVTDGKSVKRLKTGKGAHSFLPQGDGRHAFLTNRVDNTISVIDMKELSVVDTLTVPGSLGLDDMELKKDGTELWVTSRWNNTVKVIDLASKKVTHSIHVGRSPHGIYFHTHAPRH